MKLRTEGGEVVEVGTLRGGHRERKGLLNVVPTPTSPDNGLLFFYYSAADGTDEDRHRVVSVELGPDEMLDMEGEQILVRGLRGPANHDGGALALDKDGTPSNT